ncbi:hypothetical protein A7326_11190 [Stenotrophomonas maltophilia]|nr:hypothetical protein A7326_11190 [Stenotrophomonas maltophilia]
MRLTHQFERMDGAVWALDAFGPTRGRGLCMQRPGALRSWRVYVTVCAEHADTLLREALLWK